MAKPDPALLDPARYPFTCEIATRFGDLDLNRHINNVALTQICEESRVRFHRASGFHAALGETGIGSMVASFAIEYLGQGYHPAPLDVYVAAERLGDKSYTMVQLIRQEDRTIAFARGTMVCVREGVPAAIPEAFRSGVTAWTLRP